jgi:uncharacterized RDD family membrane protein YckC
VTSRPAPPRRANGARPPVVSPAGVVSRGAAFLVDAGLVVVCGCLASAVVELVGMVVGVAPLELGYRLARLWVVALPATMACYGTLSYRCAGRTAGMALLGLRVATRQGRRVGWARAVVRAVVLAFVPVAALWALVDRRHRGGHDLLSGTLVVYRHRHPPGVMTPPPRRPDWTVTAVDGTTVDDGAGRDRG